MFSGYINDFNTYPKTINICWTFTTHAYALAQCFYKPFNVIN